MTNEPAFPCEEPKYDSVDWIYFSGLTKREYVAAMMAQGMLAGLPPSCDYDKELTVRLAVEHADALLAELEKTK